MRKAKGKTEVTIDELVAVALRIRALQRRSAYSNQPNTSNLLSEARKHIEAAVGLLTVTRRRKTT
jgi:hypothetical protein